MTQVRYDPSNASRPSLAELVASEPRYWYSPRNVLGYRSAIAWEGWAIDLGIFVMFVSLGPWARTTQHAYLALSLVAGPLLIRDIVARWKGEPNE
jgi:hypothetical protein